MGKSYRMEDYEYAMEKFGFDDELSYLPNTFKDEADNVCEENGLLITIDSAKDVFIFLVQHFSNNFTR